MSRRKQAKPRSLKDPNCKLEDKTEDGEALD
ncbi:ZNF521 isoform 14, partial [Pan troglodytes]